ncbi:receptor-like protein kinase [Trifolium pratense]|uniref:Receptor-like protein kinase n=1 Tax=Trifolium pratense TaxID=57577 RepID=A0A2K3NMA9_TRIPR|nr:receptor-like protein kinase [Trifolium pratense]
MSTSTSNLFAQKITEDWYVAKAQLGAAGCWLLATHEKLKIANSFSVSSTSPDEWYHCFSTPSKIESWNNGTDCCKWDGVTCNTVSGHVIGLDLSCNYLKQLRQLNLAFNDFLESPIYHGIGDLASLTHLNLSFTGFSGNIPSSISHLSKLISLDLRGSVRLEPFTWKSLILNATNLRQLHLDGVNMSSISGSSLSQLMNLSSSLVSLSLSFTGLQGEFPSDNLSLPNLQELELSNNQNLSGQLPKSNWNTSLRNLGLSNTDFSGEIPYSIGQLKYLTLLTLEDCNFNGLVPLSLGNLTQLTFLSLASNNLKGEIPSSLSKLVHLATLDFQYNNFSGNIPDEQLLWKHANQLEGPIPQSLAHCTKLEILDLGDNNIEDIFPNWLETLQELQVLSLRSNELHGSITCSSTKHPFPKLRIYDVSSNNFSGPLPTSCFKNFQGMMNVVDNKTGLQYMGEANYYNDSVVVTIKGLSIELTRILTTFTTIDLSNNMFEGEIPQVIGELNSLKGLNLSNNGITSTIPQSLSKLRNLEWLDLSRNQLRGEIPMALTKLIFLSFLNLSQNHLEGIIPNVQQFNTFGNDSYEGNTTLCGLPMSKSCKTDEDQSPYLTFNEEEESGFGWKAVVIGYGCGSIFGMLLGYSVFMNGKPEWLARLVENTFSRTNNRAGANRSRMN